MSIQNYKVTSIPTTFTPNSFYYVKNADNQTFTMYVSDASVINTGAMRSIVPSDIIKPWQSLSASYINLIAVILVTKGRYIIDNSQASLALSLPTNPNVGDDVTLVATGGYNYTLFRTGGLIMGLAEDLIVDNFNVGLVLIYTGTVRGWVIL
jgi:hypothetical protein